jgi:hypothetical protein
LCCGALGPCVFYRWFARLATAETRFLSPLVMGRTMCGCLLQHAHPLYQPLKQVMGLKNQRRFVPVA